MSKNISVSTLQKPFDVSNLKIETPFVCMIYSNQKVTIDEISLVADWLISSGCRYVVCAGKDCQLWHDVIDENLVMKYIEVGDDEFAITTWHENETIEDVVFFWLQTANFDNMNFENYLALIIGESKEVEQEIQQSIKENSL